MTEQRPNENTIRAVARILRTARKKPVQGDTETADIAQEAA